MLIDEKYYIVSALGVIVAGFVSEFIASRKRTKRYEECYNEGYKKGRRDQFDKDTEVFNSWKEKYHK